MNKRLQQFLNAENISQSQFADTVGVAKASVSHILAGRNKPGFEFIESVARHFPRLNLEWLICDKEGCTSLFRILAPRLRISSPLLNKLMLLRRKIIHQRLPRLSYFTTTERSGNSSDLCIFVPCTNNWSDLFCSDSLRKRHMTSLSGC